MKLTKGKISKLYNKKKQSLKKNKKGKSSKKKTFRRKRRMNLANSSLKNIRCMNLYGGYTKKTEPSSEFQDPEAQLPSEVLKAKTIVPEDQQSSQVQNQDKPSTQDSEPETIVPVQPSTQDSEQEDIVPKVQQSSEVSEPETIVQTPIESSSEISKPESIVPLQQSSEDQNQDKPSSEDQTQENIVSEDQPSSEVQKPETNIPLQPEPPSELQSDNIREAFNTIIDDISNKIAIKISQDLNLNKSNESTDGFKNVEENASQFAAFSKGGKKSRKFKLTNKRKTHKRKI